MALVSLGGLAYPDYSLATNQGTINITTASNQFGSVIQVPKAGNIDRFSLQMETVTTGATMDWRIETVGANGVPTGTLWGTNTNNNAFVVNATDDNLMLEAIMTASATVARGDIIALVASNPAVSPGNISYRTLSTPLTGTFPYNGSGTTGAWTKSAGTPCCTIHYDDGTRYQPRGCMAVRNATTQTINSTTTPDEVGIKFSLPFKATIRGILAAFAGSATAAMTIKLYDASDNLLASLVLGTIQKSATTSIALKSYEFTSSYTVDKNTVYRVTFLPTNNTNWTVEYIDADSTTWVDTWILGQNYIWTERTDAGAWTDTTTKRLSLALIVDEVDDGLGAGGIVTQVYQ